MNIEIIIANIVNQPDVEAIVNSANANLRFGSGVAGAVHTAAGPELEAYTRPFAPLALGTAVATPGFNLPNRWIIHMRAPHFLNDDESEANHRRALDSMTAVASALGIASLAIPAVGTGVYRTPPTLAATWMAQAFAALGGDGALQLARVCVVSRDLQVIYANAFAAVGFAPSLSPPH